MKGMHANGLYSSSLLWSSLKGRTSNKLSGMDSVCLLLLVYLLRSFFFWLRSGRRFVLRGNGSKLGSVMAVIFKKVEKEGYFFLCLFWCGAEFMGSA